MKKSNFIEEKIKEFEGKFVKGFKLTKIQRKNVGIIEDFLRQALKEQEANFEAFYAVKELKNKAELIYRFGIEPYDDFLKGSF